MTKVLCAYARCKHNSKIPFKTEYGWCKLKQIKMGGLNEL